MGPVPNPNAYSNYVSGICGVVKANDGNDHVMCEKLWFNYYFVIDVKVVVGSGFYDYSGEIMIYSQKDNSFQFGPSLPRPLEGAASVQYGDSFIVVGGYDDTYLDSTEVMDYTTTNSIRRDVSSMQWREVICFLEFLISCFETTLTNNMYNMYTNIKRVK